MALLFNRLYIIEKARFRNILVDVERETPCTNQLLSVNILAQDYIFILSGYFALGEDELRYYSKI